MTDERRTPDFGDGEPVIRDRRRIDPQTGEPRTPPASEASSDGSSGTPPGAGGASTPPGAGAPDVSDVSDVEEAGATDGAALSARELELTKALAERTADLQRLQAEYVNYKRRVDRDREVNREIAVGSVLLELLNTLDDIDRAREAGELEGAFKAVAESVERVVEKAGLVKYGEVGDPFDPRIHEALMHNYSDEVAGPTCTLVMQPGYRLGERILRAARVAVSEPTEQLPDTTEEDVAPEEQAEDK